MLYKQEIYDYLKENSIPHEITEHQAVFNMEEVSAIDLPHPEADAKNLFIRDNRHKNYFMITVKGDKRVDLKEFRRKLETRPLTFVRPDELMDILGLIPGAVTPFGLLNDSENKVTLYIDAEFREGTGLIGVHPNDNTATVWLKVEDLIDIIRKHGNEVHVEEL